MRIPALTESELENLGTLRLIFDTGEEKVMSTHTLLSDLNDIGVGRFTSEDLKAAIAKNGVLVFPTKRLSLTGPDGKKAVQAYELDPDYLYHRSVATSPTIGYIFREMRQSKGMSLRDMAKKIPTDYGRLSKFERDLISVEFQTMQRFFFKGFGIKLSRTLSRVLGEASFQDTNVRYQSELRNKLRSLKSVT